MLMSKMQASALLFCILWIAPSHAIEFNQNKNNSDFEERYDKFKERADKYERGGNSRGNFVLVEASPNGYYHEIKNFSVSDGCGQPNKHNNSTIAIHKGYNDCLGDTYSYTLIYKERSLATSGSDKNCSGFFTISGNRSNATLEINSTCDATFREF